VWGERTSSTVSYTEGGVNKTISTSAVYDGWGQMTSSVDANGAQRNYTYDNMGHRLTQTNPFPQGGTPGPSTSYQYDELSRPTLTTLPGGNTIQSAYAGGNIVQVTDQVNRKTKRESDSLGRLIKVTEQDVSTGNLTQETMYTYDVADHLIGVNQGNQTRAFKYDAEGHLLFERIPEMTATINDGSGTYWTTKYTYTDFGKVGTKQDARGVIVTYGYDNLNRVTSVSYNTSGAPGVASTPTVTYNYDTNQSSSTNGLLLSVSVGSGYSESYSYDSLKRVQSVTRTMDNRNYAMSFQFDTANQVTQMTYPSNRVINIGHDSKGRVSSVGSYLSSVTYDGIGRLSGTTLGNGVSEGLGYDPNRMQLISQTATKNGGSTNGLANLTYGYDAAAGQTGTGSTAGNAGQLMSISGTISQTTESAAYSYDDLGRLVTSNQTSNGSSAQRRFVYDRWGNRTGMWDAVSGGTQIQSIALQQSGGAPTNQIQSVTSGSTVNYTYDSAGDVTNDGTHSYTYDAANRIVSVDGGFTATYAYDQSNQRYKKTVGSSVTHYIWQDSRVIAEHNGGTGSSTADYLYSGSRMIAKAAGLTTQYFLSDRLSARLVLNTGGTVVGRMAHLPFGEDFAESGTQEKHHFTNYERDAESGLDYAVNRSNSSNLGRFQEADPYKASGYLVDPQSWNRYAYTRNDSVNLFDSIGLFSNGFIDPPPEVDPQYNAAFGGFSYPEPISENEAKYQGPQRDQLAVLRRKFEKAMSLALKALKKDACKALFDTSKFDPRNLLAALEEGDLSLIPGVAPGTQGSISFEQLTDDQGNPIPSTSAITTGILGTDGNGASAFLGVAIYINDDPRAAWSRPGGFGDKIAENEDTRRAVTLIHELGHAAAWLFGADASKIGDDQDNNKKSKDNSQLVYDSCFK
jgi:RHS repeat-associated protein